MTLERAGEQFNRAMRLTRGREIARVFRGGLSVSNPYVIIRAIRRGENSPPRIAFALARRHVASAVRRNRAKRIVRESFRRHVQKLKGFDIVVVSRPALAGAGSVELRQEMDRHWSRVTVDEVAGRGPRMRTPKPPPADQAPRRSGANNLPPVD